MSCSTNPVFFLFALISSFASIQIAPLSLAYASDLSFYSINANPIGSTSATFTWGTTSPATGKIIYGTTLEYGSQLYSSTLSIDHSFNLSELQPNTVYHYQLSAKSQDGQFLRSEDFTFKTTRDSSLNSFGNSKKSTYNLYLDPNGDDSQDGQSPNKPIKTLAQAQKLLFLANPEANVRINLNSGTYYGQTVVWTFVRPQYYLTIAPTSNSKGLPIFDGCPNSGISLPNSQCLGRTFFKLSSFSGSPTNITLDHLQIQNYWAAIVLSGKADDVQTDNSNNTIENCAFYNIGNNFNPDLPFGMYAIQLWNSKRNIIKNNTFVDIANTYNLAWLHGIYIATYSSDNIITGNKFTRVTGDPIRVRNNSNNNIISNNTFSKTGIYAVFSDWYCRSDLKLSCTFSECPSWNNTFSNNLYDTSFNGSPINASQIFQSDIMNGCTSPSTTSMRISTLNNQLVQ